MQTLLSDSNLLDFGGVLQAVKNLCWGLLKETPTADIPLMISFKGLNCYAKFSAGTSISRIKREEGLDRHAQVTSETISSLAEKTYFL